MPMADTLDSPSPTYKDKEPFLWAACEHACRNIGQSAICDVWPALVSEVQKLVNEHMWKTNCFLILHILEQCANNFVDNDRPSSTTLLNLYRPSSHRPSLLSSTTAYNYHKRQEPHEDAVSVVSDRSSTLPDGNLDLQFKVGRCFNSVSKVANAKPMCRTLVHSPTRRCGPFLYKTAYS